MPTITSVTKSKILTPEERDFADLVRQIYSAVTKERDKFKREFYPLKSSYIVEGILNVIVEDALTPDILTGDIVEFGSPDAKIHKSLETLQRRFDFDILIDDIIMDLVTFGDYTVKMIIHKGEGVIEVRDSIVQNTIIPIYDQGYPSKYICLEDSKLVIKEPHEYVNFILGRNKIRFDLRPYKISEKFFEEQGFHPSNVRIGRPMLYGVLDKIKELALLESLVPATKLSQLSTGSIVSVLVPPTMNPDEAFNATKRYEQVLNQRIGLNRDGNLFTVADIVSVFGKIKVVPQYGDKGTLSPIDVKDNRNVDDLLNSIQGVRQSITTSIGIPSEVIFGGDIPQSDLLRRYARYMRKVKSVQSSVRQGLTQIAMAHLVNCGFDKILPSDIQIAFKNESINIDELEKLEYVEAALTQVSQAVNFLTTMDQNPSLAPYIDYPKSAEELKKMLLNIGSISNIINDKAKLKPQPQPTQGDEGDYYDEEPVTDEIPPEEIAAEEIPPEDQQLAN